MTQAPPHEQTHSLPSLPTSFIGRAAELAAIGEMLANPACRLVTLVGPGGIGKTRLSLEAARASRDRFADGARFVALQSAETVDALVAAVAQAVDCVLSGQESLEQQLFACLRDQELLLVLDNFEQLLGSDGAAVVSRLLAEAPGLKLLVSSRETLNLQEEWLYPVQGMPVGGDDATQLFVDRACRVRPDFDAISESDAIGRICQLVDGIPLALELAATWVKSLPCAAIADEIGRSLDFLETNLRNVPDRHRSMQAVFEQSWRLLSPDEQRTFARLTVFRGGFRRDAAEAVAGASLWILTALVDKSMLRVRADGRYDIHELLRQYAAEKLDPEALASALAAHCAFYAQFLGDHLPDLVSGRQFEAMREMQAEDDNIRAAWQWALDHRALAQLELAAEPLALFYRYQSRHVETLPLFRNAQACIEQPGGERASDMLRLVVRMTLVWTEIRLGRLDEAEAMLDECLELADRMATLPLSGYAASPLVALAGISLFRGDYARALEIAEQAERVSLMRNHASARYRALYVLTRAARGLGQYDRAKTYAELTYEAARAHNDPWFMAYGLTELGHAALHAKDFAGAQARYEEVLALRRRINDPEGAARALLALGQLDLQRGDVEAAQARFGASWESFQKIRDAEGMAAVRQGLAQVALKRDDVAVASRYLLDALSLVESIDAAPAAFPVLNDAAELLVTHGALEPGVKVLLLVAHHPYTTFRERARASTLLAPYAVSFVGLAEYPLGRAIADARAGLVALAEGPSESAAASGVDWSERHLTALLSDREREVLRLLGQALSNQEIAERMVVGVSTVKKHINHIYSKLGLTNRVQAMHLARKLPPE